MKFLFPLIVAGLTTPVVFANEGHDNASLFPQPKADSLKAIAPKSPELLEPAFQAEVNGDSTTLKWKETDGASVYHVQVATDPNFKWLRADDHFVKGPSYEIKGLEKGKLYFWRVASWHDGNMAATNKSGFSASSFETK